MVVAVGSVAEAEYLPSKEDGYGNLVYINLLRNMVDCLISEVDKQLAGIGMVLSSLLRGNLTSM